MISVIGSANIDYICHNEKIPEPGETVFGDNFLVTPGGKGANQAVAAARLGAEVCLFTMLGEKDKYVDVLTHGFRWAGVDFSRAGFQKDSYCGCAVIMVDQEGQNIITVVQNSNSAVTPEYIDDNLGILEQSNRVLIDFGIPIETAEYTAKILAGSGTRIIVTPGPVLPIKDSFYANISILTPSKSEAASLSGIEIKDMDTAKAAADFFHDKGVVQVVITMGEEGVFVSSCASGEKLARIVPAYPVEAVDTTGGGDAFTGALAFSLDRGESLINAVYFANAAAALCVTRQGTSAAMADYGEVERFIKERGYHV